MVVALEFPLLPNLRYLTVRHRAQSPAQQSTGETSAFQRNTFFRNQFPARPQMARLEVLCIGRPGRIDITDLMVSEIDLPRLHTVMLAGPTVSSQTVCRLVSISRLVLPLRRCHLQILNRARPVQRFDPCVSNPSMRSRSLTPCSPWRRRTLRPIPLQIPVRAPPLRRSSPDLQSYKLALSHFLSGPQTPLPMSPTLTRT